MIISAITSSLLYLVVANRIMLRHMLLSSINASYSIHLFMAAFSIICMTSLHTVVVCSVLTC